MPLRRPQQRPTDGIELDGPPGLRVPLHGGFGRGRKGVVPPKGLPRIPGPTTRLTDSGDLLDERDKLVPILGPHLTERQPIPGGEQRERREEGHLRPQHTTLPVKHPSDRPSGPEDLTKPLHPLTRDAVRRQIDLGEGTAVLDDTGTDPGGLDPDDGRSDTIVPMMRPQDSGMLNTVQKGHEEGVTERLGRNALKRGVERGVLDTDETDVNGLTKHGIGVHRGAEVPVEPTTHPNPVGTQRLDGPLPRQTDHTMPGTGEQPRKQPPDPTGPKYRDTKFSHDRSQPFIGRPR